MLTKLPWWCRDHTERVKEWWYHASRISGYMKISKCHWGGGGPEKGNNRYGKWCFKRIWCTTQSRKMTVWSQFFDLEAVLWLKLKLRTCSIQCTHSSLDLKIFWGSFSCLIINYSAKMTCAVGRAKSDQKGVIKSVKDGTWYTFGNLYEIGQVAQAYIRPQTVSYSCPSWGQI